jgi:hypothetical protein
VLDGFEAFDRLAADALCWGIGGGKFRVLFFEIDQLLHHLVELAIGDFGGALVIEIVVVLEFLAELVDSLLGSGHR